MGLLTSGSSYFRWVFPPQVIWNWGRSSSSSDPINLKIPHRCDQKHGFLVNFRYRQVDKQQPYFSSSVTGNICRLSWCHLYVTYVDCLGPAPLHSKVFLSDSSWSRHLKHPGVTVETWTWHSYLHAVASQSIQCSCMLPGPQWFLRLSWKSAWPYMSVKPVPSGWQSSPAASSRCSVPALCSSYSDFYTH